MKKRFLPFLAILFALAFIPFINKENKTNEFYESVENIDVFGNSFGEVKLNESEYSLCSSESLVKPKIGYQSVLSQDLTKISIRYTALISDLDITAIWTRALYDNEGNISNKLLKAKKEVTKCYTGITNNGIITYATDYEDSNGNHPYKYFVVYSLLDIPLSLYSNYYLDAYLTISNDDEKITTKAGALRIDQGDFFTYDINDELSYVLDGSSYKVEECLTNVYDKLVVPTYYSSDTNRLKVTKISSTCLYDIDINYLIIPNTILEIEEGVCNSNTRVNYLCYLGSNLEFDNLTIGSNPYFESKIIYFYDEAFLYCNSFKFEDDNVIVNDVNHVLTTKEENITATCDQDGTYDLVTYCSICGKELKRETKEKMALGHSYTKEVITNNLGHTYTKHECEYCSDTYLDNLVVDYTKSYEYMTLTENDYYSSYSGDLKKIYDNFYQGCLQVLESKQDFVKEGTINYNGVDVDYKTIASAPFGTFTQSQAFAIANSFVDSNPQFYFLDNMILYDSNTVYLCINQTYWQNSKREEMNELLKKTEEDFSRAYLNENLDSDILKAKFIHDYLANELFYQYEADGKTPSDDDYAHSIIGFIDQDSETGVVCEGYAKSYLYLSNLIGLESILVSGNAGGSTDLGGHAWNYTKINDSWYGIDVTWDDGDEYGINYTYFLASKDTMYYDSSYDAYHIVGESDLEKYSGSYFQVLLPELSLTKGY